MSVRELKNATITHVSYVDKGANKKQFFLTKSDEKPTFQKDVNILINKEDEKRLVYGVVYEPNVPDAHKDMMKADEIEKSAHTFLKEYRNIDKQHDFQGGYGEVVESYVAPQDFTVGEDTIAKGSWVLVTKADEDTWDSIKKGEITGYSMAGVAEVSEVEKQKQAEDSQMNKFFKTMKEFFVGDVSKSAFKDEYSRTRKRRNLFDALWMFEDFASSEITNDTPDAVKLQELAQDLGDILHEVASSQDLIKSVKKQYEERNEVHMNKEEMQELMKEALAPINEKLESMEKEEEVVKEEGKKEVEKEKEKEKEDTQEDLKKELAEVIKNALDPINERLDKVEKSRGISKSVDDDATGQTGEKEESVYKDLFTYRGQL